MKPLLKSEIKNVAIRSPNWLGDAVMALPAVRAVSEIFTPERLTVLARGQIENFWGRYSFVDEVLPFSRGTEREAHRRLAKKGIDAFILFTGSFRSAWNALWTGAPIRLGYAGDLRSLLLTHPVRKNDRLHMTSYYLRLLKIADPSDFSKHVEFPLKHEEVEFAGGVSPLAGAVGIPLGAKFGPAKCWPDVRLKEFLRIVMERTGRSVVLFGTEGEREQAGELADVNPERIQNLAGKTTIGEMAAVMDRCETIVANDSGPLHIAASLGKKVVALFGSTDPAKTSPRSRNVRIVKKDTDCAPCFERECPDDFHCMMDISAEEVFEEMGKDAKN